ncbi:GMC family oxidoreductase N-terminal domain-containing protein [Pseudonocardia xinjiangensis]|uniref:GMC family oxidoreductase N-terminal domain-containing protein n=1 Tax=Pseudonocardia xinjiangensis TaxID=75289 RepID=UPI003D8FAD20
METDDHGVVGGGSAPCVLAARLSENPGTRVLLLEAGPATGPPAMSVPARWQELLGSTVDWAYETVPQRGTNGTVHAWPRGRVLGGSAAINGMAFPRGDRSVFDGLLVAQASVIPSVPSMNPNATVLAIAERGADLIIDAH